MTTREQSVDPLLMDEPTEVLAGGAGTHFAVAGDDSPGVDVVWSRDGRSGAGVGAGGDIVETGEDLFSRYIRARAPDGAEFVAEIQRDVVASDEFPVTWGPVTNAVLDAVWRRVTLGAMAVSEDSVGAVTLGFDAHAPLLVCREMGKAFRPPSPRSGRPGALVECRDEELLARSRLPSWAGSARRFVYDSHAARGTSTPRFYTADETRLPDENADVVRWDGFVRDLGRIARPDTATVAAASAATAAATLPCVRCPDVARCFPGDSDGRAGLASRRLRPVALHPFHALAHREDVLRFDEHCDVLGGAPWSAFRQRHGESWGARGTRMARESLERSDVFVRMSAPSPLTALREKLALFAAVVDRVAEYHRRHGQPHLGLAPQTIVSHAIGRGDDGEYDVSLRASLRGVMLQDLMPTPPGPTIWLPPPHAVPPYAHRDIRQAAEPIARVEPHANERRPASFRHGREVPVRVTVGRVWDDAVHDTVQCELDVSGLALGSTELHDCDRVRIRLDGAGWHGATVWCRPDLERLRSEATPLRTFPTRLDSGQVLDLRAAHAGRAMFGVGVVYRTYGAWYDVHALGVLLLRGLLENVDHTVQRLVDDALHSLTPFCRAVRATDTRSAWDQLVDVIEDVAHSAPLDGFVAPENVCYLPGEVRDRAAEVPSRSWAEVLATIAACVTSGTRTSLCSTTRLVTDRAEFCVPIEQLRERVRGLLARLPQPSTAGDDADATHVVGVLDPRDVRIHGLEAELRSSAAQIERLTSEVETLTRARDEAPAATVVDVPESTLVDSAAGDVWRGLYEDLAGVALDDVPAPDRSAPGFQLVRAVGVEGLAALSVSLAALAELGGQEHALRHRDLARSVRQALRMAAEGTPGYESRVADVLRELRDARGRLGSAIGVLVEAHGRSSVDGARQMLLTLSYAMRRELELSTEQSRGLADILRRMEDGLGDLVARLYEPTFQSHVRDHLTSAAAAARSSRRKT